MTDTGKQSVKSAYGKCRQGAMEKANAFPVMGLDRDWNIIPRESGQTSIRSFFTREFIELFKEEIANEWETVCIIPQRTKLGYH